MEPSGTLSRVQWARLRLWFGQKPAQIGQQQAGEVVGETDQTVL
jgi:hypothetical protein